MYLVAIAWIYVVLMMAVAEAMSPQGTLLGAFFTLLLYGAAPLALVLYVMGTPLRRRVRRAQEAAEDAQAAQTMAEASAAEAADATDAVGTGPSDPGAAAAALTRSGPAPDGGGQSSGDAVQAVRKEA
jgi:type II secretory pathway component PulM